MNRRKTIIAIAIFVIAGLAIFTFANPLGDNETNEPDIALNEQFDEAEDAVSKAEESLLQSDADSARELVSNLPDSDRKDAFNDRLDTVDALIEAINAVVKAEASLLQEDVDAARLLVVALPDSDTKDDLLARLDAIQAIIDASNQGDTEEPETPTDTEEPETPLDTVRPILSLNGVSPVYTILGVNSYLDQGARVIDNIDATRVVFGVINGNTGVVGSYQLVYNANDTSLNAALQIVRTINILDPAADFDGDGYTNEEEFDAGTDYTNDQDYPSYNSDPEITITENNTFSIEVYEAVPTFTATAVDDYDGNISVSISNNIDNTKVGTYSVTFSATDSLGNVSTLIRDFKVVDTTKPIINLIGANYIYGISGLLGYTDQGANVTDNYDLNTLIYGTPAQTFIDLMPGLYNLNYNSVDTNNNAANEVIRGIMMLDPAGDYDNDGYSNEEEFIIGTDYLDENDYPEYDKNPLVTISENNIYQIEVFDSIPDFSAVATDEYYGDLVVTITNDIDNTQVGTYTVMFTVTDINGNITTITKDFEVVDSTSPTLTLNGNTTVYAISGVLDYSDEGAIFEDNYDADVVIYGTPATSFIGAEPGTYTLTYEASDSSLNSSNTLTRTVIVISRSGDFDDDGYSNEEEFLNGTDYLDSESYPSYEAGPTIELSENNIYEMEVLTPSLRSASQISFEATATDVYDGVVLVTITHEIDLYTVAIYVVTFTATDSNGNVTTITRNFEVKDTAAPEISLNGSNNITTEAGISYSDLGATAYDSYDGNITSNIVITFEKLVNDEYITVSYLDTSVLATYRVTYTISDSSSNKAFVNRVVAVTDTLNPVFNNYDDETISLGSTFVDNISAYDLLDGDITANIIVTGEVDTTVEGTYLLNYSVSDSSGHTASVSRTITVYDYFKEAIAAVVAAENEYYNATSGGINEAEVLLIQSKIDYAWPLVNALPDGAQKTDLVNRLNALQYGLDYLDDKDYANALKAVIQYLKTGSQGTYNEASNKIQKIEDEALSNLLTTILNSNN